MRAKARCGVPAGSSHAASTRIITAVRSSRITVLMRSLSARIEISSEVLVTCEYEGAFWRENRCGQNPGRTKLFSCRSFLNGSWLRRPQDVSSMRRSFSATSSNHLRRAAPHAWVSAAEHHPSDRARELHLNAMLPPRPDAKNPSSPTPSRPARHVYLSRRSSRS